MSQSRNLLAHMQKHPFVGMSAFAASVHTAWAFGTLFGGMQPKVSADISVNLGLWLAETVALCMWLLPAIALAIALDIGMVETSRDIHEGDVSTGRYATFAALAAGSYYMQMLHLAIHMPELQLSNAVAQAQADSVIALRNAAVFIVPLLLQLPILLHVLSARKDELQQGDAMQAGRDVQKHEHVHVHMDSIKELPQQPAVAPALPAQARVSPRGNKSGEATSMVHPGDHGDYVMHCELCGKHQEGYKSETSAKRAASAHIGLYCISRQEQKVDAQ